jgi:hypothetical protein
VLFKAPGVLILTVILTLIPCGAALAAVSATPQPTASFNGAVYSVLYVGNTVYVGGSFTEATDPNGTPVPRNHVAAVDASTGQLLSGWNPDTDGPVYAMTAVTGGIALGGSFSTVGGASHANLAVVDPISGSPTSFSGSANRMVRALATGPTGRLYVGGTFSKADGQARAGLAAFAGNTLSRWAPVVSGGAVLTLHVANGWVFAGGDFSSVNGVTGSGFLTALDSAGGAVVDSWNPRISIRVYALQIDSTNGMVYVGADGRGGHLEAFTLAAGTHKWTVLTDGGVQALTLMGTDLYFGGHFDYVEGIKQRKLGLVTVPAGDWQRSWAPQANSPHGVNALDNDGSKVAAGGAFTTFDFGAVTQPYFAQFAP